MSEIDIDRVARELSFGKFLNRLIVDYKDIKLSDGQLYTLYQDCANEDEFKRIINEGVAENLP